MLVWVCQKRRAATSCRSSQKRSGHFENLIRAVLKLDAVDPRCTGYRVPVQCVVLGPAVRPRQVSRGEWRSPPFPRGDVLLQARHAVIVDEPLVAHARLLHDRHEPAFSGTTTAMMASRPTGPRPWASTAIAASVPYPLFQQDLMKW